MMKTAPSKVISNGRLSQLRSSITPLLSTLTTVHHENNKTLKSITSKRLLLRHHSKTTDFCSQYQYCHRVRCIQLSTMTPASTDLFTDFPTWHHHNAIHILKLLVMLSYETAQFKKNHCCMYPLVLHLWECDWMTYHWSRFSLCYKL